MTFSDGSTALGSAPLTGGVATFTTSSLELGTHTIVATYPGDSAFRASVSHPIAQVVVKGTPVITWPAPASIVYGTALGSTQLDATANVPGTFIYSPPAGTVLHAGNAQVLSVSFTPGDTVHYNPASASTLIDVQPAATTTTAFALPSPVGFLQPALLAALVRPVGLGAGSPNGVVQFKDGPTVVGSASVTGGIAYVIANGLAPGAHAITAVFSGSGDFNGSGSTPASLSVAPLTASTFTLLVPLTNPQAAGQLATFAALVLPLAGGTPTGTVQFREGSTILGTAAVNGSDVATLSTSALGVGLHGISARYLGSAKFAASSGIPQLQTIYTGARPGATTTALSMTPGPSTLGQAVALTGTVTGATAGDVNFYADGGLLGHAPLADVGGTFQATLIVSTLTRGVHVMSASYGGSSGFAASNTLLAVQVVQ